MFSCYTQKVLCSLASPSANGAAHATRFVRKASCSMYTQFSNECQREQTYDTFHTRENILSSQRPFIVCVDDSPTVRKILETCLRREGFTVSSFADGVVMLRWLIGPEGRVPDLVILDVTLPKIDGYEVARRLKAHPHCAKGRIVMLSRRDRVIDRLKGRLAGASVYLTKPFKTQELVAVVKAQLGIAPSDEHDTSVACSMPGEQQEKLYRVDNGRGVRG